MNFFDAIRDPFNRMRLSRISSRARGLDMTHYTQNRNGTIRRLKVKRPPSMSARQWKKFYKLARRRAKAVA